MRCRPWSLCFILQDRQNVGNVVNQIQIDERLRQAVLHMISSGGPHAAYDASMLFAAAATGTAAPPLHQPPDVSDSNPNLRSPHSNTPHPLTPERSAAAAPARSLNRCQTPTRRGHIHEGGRMYPYASPSNSSMHTASYAPDLSPPLTPGVFNTPPNLTPRNRDRSGHSGTLPSSRNQASSSLYSRRGAAAPPPAASEADATSDHLPRKPSFKMSALQSMYDDKAASEPLPGHKGGTGVFIPGLHRQPNTSTGSGVSQPIGANGSGSSAKAPLSGPLSDVTCSLSLGTVDVNDAQTSPDSLAGSAELPRVRPGCTKFPPGTPALSALALLSC